jgi:Uma2 family endonuclease
LHARGRDRTFRVFVAQRVQVIDEPRYQIPDICVKALPHEITPILSKPDLAIEIVSPDDTVPDMLAKVGEYLAGGIPYIWVVDAYRRTVIEAHAQGIRRCASGIAATELVGSVDFTSLFAQLDQK